MHTAIKVNRGGEIGWIAEINGLDLRGIDVEEVSNGFDA